MRFLGLATSYWVLNKFQESWGQKIQRDTGLNPNIHSDDVVCCNIKNCADAWCRNPDCIKLVKSKCALLCFVGHVAIWVICILYNLRLSPANDAICNFDNRCLMIAANT